MGGYNTYCISTEIIIDEDVKARGFSEDLYKIHVYKCGRKVSIRYSSRFTAGLNRKPCKRCIRREECTTYS